MKINYEGSKQLNFKIKIILVLGFVHCKKRVKEVISLQAWTGLKGSKRLRLPNFMTIGT